MLGMFKLDSQRLALWLVSTLTLALLALAPRGAAAQNLATAAAAVDECVQKASAKRLVSLAVEITKLDQAFVEKALAEGGCKASDLVCLQAIAAKSGQSPEAVLAANPAKDWAAAAKRAGLPMEELFERLDDAYAEFALRKMDFPDKKKDLKRTAKR